MICLANFSPANPAPITNIRGKSIVGIFIGIILPKVRKKAVIILKNSGQYNLTYLVEISIEQILSQLDTSELLMNKKPRRFALSEKTGLDN